MKRVLVVDDSPTEAYQISNILNKHGYEVVAVESGEAAVELASEQTTNLVLMDIVMPLTKNFWDFKNHPIFLVIRKVRQSVLSLFARCGGQSQLL